VRRLYLKTEGGGHREQGSVKTPEKMVGRDEVCDRSLPRQLNRRATASGAPPPRRRPGVINRGSKGTENDFSC